MRPPSLVRALSVPLLVVALAACGDDADGGDEGGQGGDGAVAGLSAEEQAFADAWASTLADDDGFSATAAEADCMGAAIMGEVGAEPFADAGVEPADIEGEDDSPGEVLGAGVISEPQANAILDRWEDCVDLPALFAESAVDEFDLDAEGAECVADGLAEGDLVRAGFLPSFTSDDDEPGPDVIAGFVTVIDECSTGPDGDGGFLVDQIAQSILDDSDLTQEQASCVAQEMVDTIGLERLLELGAEDLDFDDADPALQQEIGGAVLDAAGTCDVPLSELGD
jgi:hypothetical protein